MHRAFRGLFWNDSVCQFHRMSNICSMDTSVAGITYATFQFFNAPGGASKGLFVARIETEGQSNAGVLVLSEVLGPVLHLKTPHRWMVSPVS